MIDPGDGRPGRSGARRRVRVATLAAAVALVAVSAVALPDVAGAVLEPPPSRTPAVHRIGIKAFVYAPDTVAVAPGDTVVWINEDPVPHTVTAPGRFDSGRMAVGAEFRWVVTGTDTVRYHCTYHPIMRGVLVPVAVGR